MVTTVLLVILFVIYFALWIAGFKKKSSLKLEGILQIVQGALWSLIAIENWAERSMVVRIVYLFLILTSFITGAKALYKSK